MNRPWALCGMAAATLILTMVLPGSPGAPAAYGQQKTGEFTPRLGQSGKDVMWLPSPDAMVDRMLVMGQVTSRDYLVDLGSGDGKIPIAAARSRGARALGLEYNPDLVEVSKKRAIQAGVEKRAEFRQADIFVTDFSSADIVTLYLLPELNLRLRPILFKMKPGTRIVSNSFDMQTWKPDEVSHVGTASSYLWIIPAHVGGAWTVSYRPAKNSAPLEITLRQRFQMIEGEASFTGVKAGLQSPVLRGKTLSFVTRDVQGNLLSFHGEVNGDRISGTVRARHFGQARFNATRGRADAAFEEAVGTDQEKGDAVRALGNP